MPKLPQAGTFVLYPFAEPPVPAGSYLLTGDVSGLPGAVQQMSARVEVTAPRYALPPDQILSTFPPAGSRGAFGSRLPQIVLRRRTLPWERSPDLDADVETTPTPWLALVLIAEGEGTLLTGVPAGNAVTPGTVMGDDADVTSGACLEVPQDVVDKVFPTRDDLRLLCHVRAVDLQDTELAMSDDDGWMAVVLCNRLPQPGVRYLACLINLEQQYGVLPTVPDAVLMTRYLPAAGVFDLRTAARDSYGDQASYDTVTMHLPGASRGAAVPEGPAAEGLATGPGTEGTTVSPARGPSARTGSAWSSVATPRVEPSTPDAGTRARMVLADGFAYSPSLIAAVAGPRRFPVLAYWSFTCDEGGDFQHLATQVHTRMLGHVITGPETPDGDPLGPDDGPQPGIVPEPNPTRPLPLVTQTGHLRLGHVSRDGEPSPAWFRGPLAPAAVPRGEGKDGGPPPLAHGADQLRQITPDGQEDLGYAAAFELGRLLALSQPGVVAALSRWRAECFGAARVQALVGDASAPLPADVQDRLGRPDPLTDGDGVRPRTLGARASRAVVDLLGTDPDGALGPVRPVADPGVAARVLAGVHADGDAALLAGLGVPGVQAGTTAAQLLAQVSAAPAAVAAPDIAARTAAVRQVLEVAAASIADAALADVPSPPAAPHLSPAAAPPDALDQLIEARTRALAGEAPGDGGER
jgi:hypothetical protein